MKDNAASSLTPPQTPNHDVYPAAWAGDDVFWQAEPNGGIKIYRKPATASSVKAAATNPDLAPKSAPSVEKPAGWWTKLNGWREAMLNTLTAIVKFGVTLVNWTVYALSLGKITQLVRWEPQPPIVETPTATTEKSASVNPEPDFTTGNYDALTIAAEQASKLPPQPQAPSAQFTPKSRRLSPKLPDSTP